MTQPVVGDNIEVPGSGPEPWMLELAKMLILNERNGDAASFYGHEN